MEKVKIIADYLRIHKDNIESLYQWKSNLNELFSLIDIGESEKNELINYNEHEKFAKEVSLKKVINKHLRQSIESNDSERFNKIANWIVKVWGGIKTGSALDNEIIDKIKQKKALPFTRIASYSKIAAFLHLKDFIIYDSRVAYSLNWILLSNNIETLYFPIPEGRNSKMTAFDMNVLIRLNNKQKYNPSDETDIEKGLFVNRIDKKIYFNKDEAYDELNKLIKLVHKELWGVNDTELYKTEMLLFSIADSAVYLDIVRKVNFSIN